MKKLLLILILLFSFIVSNAQNYDRNALVEVFTNSHCPLCPPAHASLNSYLANGSGKDNVTYIYYHMVFPYPSDQLNQYNTADPAGRNNYYGPFFSTPVGFVDGTTTGYSSFASKIDTRLALKSNVKIDLSGSTVDGSFLVNADITVSQSISGNNVIHFVVVEDVDYRGNNGVSPQNHVMRKMITSPTGESIDLSSNQTISKEIGFDSIWNSERLGIIVFLQNSSTKEVYQSQFITYNELGTTDVDENNSLPISYNLSQNYPNPFNPATTIEYHIPNAEKVVLKVYNLIGQEVAELVNSNKSAGSYKVNFNAEKLASGVYYYTLSAGNFVQSKKLILLK